VPDDDRALLHPCTDIVTDDIVMIRASSGTTDSGQAFLRKDAVAAG